MSKELKEKLLQAIKEKDLCCFLVNYYNEIDKKTLYKILVQYVDELESISGKSPEYIYNDDYIETIQVFLEGEL